MNQWAKAGMVAVAGFVGIGVLMAIVGWIIESPAADTETSRYQDIPTPRPASSAGQSELQAWVTTAQPSVAEAQAAIQAMAEAASTGDLDATRRTCGDRRTRVLDAQVKVLSAPSEVVDLNYRRMMGAVTGALTACQLGNLDETQRAMENIGPAMDTFLQSIILD